MENEDLEELLEFEDLEFEDLEFEDLELLEDENTEAEELKTIDRYFDQCFKDNPTNVKFSEYNLDQSIQGEQVPTIALVNYIYKKALQENVKEIRVIPLRSEILIRFNQGSGFYKPFEKQTLRDRQTFCVIESIANIIRLNAGMEMLARNKPVVGNMLLIYFGKRKQVVIHTLPSTYGTSLSLSLKDG